jgi:hypothetical protein
MNEFNDKVLTKFLREGNLVFTKLFEARRTFSISARTLWRSALASPG